jgi:hypothetical protein
MEEEMIQRYRLEHFGYGWDYAKDDGGEACMWDDVEVLEREHAMMREALERICKKYGDSKSMRGLAMDAYEMATTASSVLSKLQGQINE